MLNLTMYSDLETAKKETVAGPRCVYVEGLGEVQINSSNDAFCIAGQAALRFPHLAWES
jgi:hypothetical protein